MSRRWLRVALALAVTALTLTVGLRAPAPGLAGGLSDGLDGVQAPAKAATMSAAALEGPLAALLARAQEVEASGLEPTIDELADGAPALVAVLAAGTLRLDAFGRVQVDALLSGDGPSTLELDALGVKVDRLRLDLGRGQFWVPAVALADVATLTGVRGLLAPTYAISQTGSINSEGDEVLGAAAVRADLGFDGSGVRIGVISDGIAGLAEAQASGDAPDLVETRSFDPDGIEAGAEGTAMIEIIHDLAPGALISFANAATDLDMIEAVDFLAGRNDIVVDDLGFFFPDDQQSAVSRNTAAALANADWPLRAYVTSVGNWALRHYEGDYEAGPDGAAALALDSAGAVHQFRVGDGVTDVLGRVVTPYNEIYLRSGDSAFIVLYWDDPWGASTNDYDLFLLSASGTVVAQSTAGQGTGVDTPRERFVYENTGADGLFRVVVQNFQDLATAQRLELFVFDSPKLPNAGTSLNFNLKRSSMLAQSDAGGGVISVAAVLPGEPDSLQLYSSHGPANNGAAKPDLAATDGVSVTGSGGFSSPFFGTSAAAPHVAAVAALLLEARPSLTDVDGGNPFQERLLVRELLLGGSIDLGEEGADLLFGAGRLDAVVAVEDSLATIVSVDSAADSGPGTLRAALETLNDASAAGAVDGGVLFTERLTIVLDAPLPDVVAGGLRILGAGSTIDGSGLSGDASGLILRGAGSTIDGLVLSGFGGAGIWVAGAAGAQILDVVSRDNGVGIRVDGGAQDVRIGPLDGVLVGGAVLVGGNTGDGIVISGAGTGAVTVRSALIGIDAAGGPLANGGVGVRIEQGASGNVIGLAPPSLGGLVTAQTAPSAHLIRGTVTINGLPAPLGTIVEAIVDGFPFVLTTLGAVDVDGLPGFVFSIPGPAMEVRFVVDGLTVDQTVDFNAGAVSTLTLEVERGAAAVATGPGGNTIAFNALGGIVIADAGTNGNTLRGNLIYGNGGRAIDLVADGGASPNGSFARPRLSSVSFVDGLATIRGTSEPGTTVDLFAAVATDALPGVGANPAGAGGAVLFLGSVEAIDGDFLLEGLGIGRASALTALATDGSGGTSEFATNLVIGSGPSIVDVSPGAGSREGNTLVTLRGSGFVAGATVVVGGREAVVVSVAADRIVVRTPASPEGTFALAVINPDGRADLEPSGFRYLAQRTVVLSPGWNNVTWAGPTTRLTAAIAQLAGRVDRIFAWDAERQDWDSFAVAAPAFINSLRELSPGQVVWLFVTASSPVDWDQPLP